MWYNGLSTMWSCTQYFQVLLRQIVTSNNPDSLLGSETEIRKRGDYFMKLYMIVAVLFAALVVYGFNEWMKETVTVFGGYDFEIERINND